MNALRTAAAGVVLGLMAAAANAMVVVERDFPELVARAEQIIVGTVTDIQQASDASGIPATLVTVADLTVLKGDVGDTLTLRLYGGASGGVVSHISDMPSFIVGERAVLFVAGNGRTVCPLVGVWQGRFRVRFDADRQTNVVESNDRAPVVGIAGRRVLRGSGGAASTGSAAMALGDFLESVAGELGHPTAAETTP